MSLKEMLTRYANRSQTPVGIRTLIDTGTGKLLGKGQGNWKETAEMLRQLNGGEKSRLPAEIGEEERRKLARVQIASFLRRELPVRFAHRARELSHAPYDLGSMPAIQEVKNWYEQSFEEVMSFDEARLAGAIDAEDEAFKDMLSSIYLRHQDTLVMIAKGLHEFQQSERGRALLQERNKDLSDVREIHEYFDRFFLSRIAIRILIGHFLELYEEQAPDFVGLVCLKTSAAQVARAAAEDARYMCERQYGEAPDVEFLGRVDLTFPYIPSHLYYVLFELLKNSMRAVAERRVDDEDMPPVRVVIADGEENEDVVIRISDLGGGIPRSISQKVFSYLFTTAHDAFPEHLEDLHDFGRENPMAGLGYGLGV
ncbi:Pyruvate dehydrogenase acetyl-transferring kinase, mitochondrial [Hondaea fermentalgiana]|uniref:Protein-serine/threonine kinase n=1 Tax=Hondaea fermentalgiana TaxID=2315210 RepID=A0A2R5GHL2_9STRA|nr:Pyruvate dehydrogenase acetyl-transferring kinase, mitochondrial [Hondaea fermentalgiana]|eukprot:GBG29208.1 Pyruvate dehydrogenase acetyl-transferring kinase, mitochondrial [Hondaea fermentalgiana]